MGDLERETFRRIEVGDTVRYSQRFLTLIEPQTAETLRCCIGVVKKHEGPWLVVRWNGDEKIETPHHPTALVRD